MISLKYTLEAIKGEIETTKGELEALRKSEWYKSGFAKSNDIGGKIGYGYAASITWTNIPSNATNIMFIPTFERWMAPLEVTSISKSGTTVTLTMSVACVVNTNVGCIGGVLMYQLS